MSKKLNSKEIYANILLQKEAIMEGVNSSEVRALISSATDLYEEIIDFEKEATPAAINALTPHLKDMKDVLEQMISNPTSYVSNLSMEKKVTLKAVKVDD